MEDAGGGKMVEDELDILLVSCGESEAATLWVNYLISCFQQISRERNKPPFKLQNIKLEDTLCPYPPSSSLAERYPDARLQIVVICPFFVQKIQLTPANENMLTKILHPEKVLAMLLGVQDHIETCRIKNVFANYDQWRIMYVKDRDPTFVGDFLGVSMDILSKSLQLQEMMNSEQDQAGYSIVPKKVKVGQNKLIVLFTEPLSADDIVKISVFKSSQRIEVTTVKRRNPYTLQFTMPACCLQVSMLVSVHIEKNGKSMGKRMVKCESKLREMEQLLRSVDNPIHFLCQSYGLNTNDRDQLDTFLLNNFLKNVPPNFNILAPTMSINRSFVCNEEYPTLLHFAAKHGLEKLSWQLIESPGGEQACQIRNSSHLTPAEMAEKANHVKLSNALKGYMQMTELSSVYNYLKGMSEKERRFVEYNYLLPRPLSDTYLIPPAARPVDPLAVPTPITDLPTSSLPFYANFKPCMFPSPSSPTSPTFSNSVLGTYGLENYDIPSNGRPCTPPTLQSPVDHKMEGYLEMNSAGHENSEDFPGHFDSFTKTDTCERGSSYSGSYSPSKYGSAGHLSNREKLSPEDELLEIINDFKNNVFTIAEVEALVESWQNRNDVQQSFRDKQEQLNKMREEYDRIQRRMKEQMKRTTPFERIRKFFGRGKSKHSESSERASVSSDVSGSHQIRTASSLSLHSSSSGSSVGNSVSSGSFVAVDGNGTRQSDRSSSVEKLKNKTSHYTEIPQPPKSLDLGVNADFSEYVQPDCITCKANNRQSCNGSVLNDTIHEGNELESSESTSASFNLFHPKHHDLSSSKKKSNGKYETNSLRTESRKSKNKARSKVKSAENLIYGREYTNVEKSHCEGNELTESSVHESSKSELAPSELSAGVTLCAEALKCLSDISVPHSAEPIAEISFEFDKTVNVSTSDCDSPAISHKSSSLALSSLSLNSNCTIDENCEIKEEKCSLELKITEEGETETETAPPVNTDSQHNYVNICKIPEYVNVNMKNQPPLTGRCKYTAVSS